MRLWRAKRHRADYARIAELEKELGIGEPSGEVHIKMEDVVVTEVGGKVVSVETIETRYPRDNSRKLLEEQFRTNPNPAVREASWEALKCLAPAETMDTIVTELYGPQFTITPQNFLSVVEASGLRKDRSPTYIAVQTSDEPT